MIFDEAANIMNMDSDRNMSHRTGLSRDKIRRISMGLPFILDYNTYFAFQRLGYDIKIVPKIEQKPKDILKGAKQKNGARKNHKS
ncbi:MAG: hypothetical protein ACOX60_06285 [Massiliimalia sp.]|jgi:FKBP-type peptidyl-prolyl cis-trans isomerase 2